jgi:hypothetical protein
MVSYILSGFFFVVGVLTVAGNMKPSELIVAVTFWTVAALVLTAQRTEDKRRAAMQRHPSGLQQDTQVYPQKKMFEDYN